jgi:cell division protein ZapE
MSASASSHYLQGVAAGHWQDDPAQRAALSELDRIQAQLSIEPAAPGWWQSLLAKTRPIGPVRGLYLWGGVGRGKTFLVDLFFESVPIQAKLRLHFHRFMGRVQAELAKLEGRADPLRDVAAHFAEQARLLCLDEFFVSDIGDAMILGRLLEHLFARGVTLVTTSNIQPSALYRDGLQRAKFLPAIALIERHCTVYQLVSPQDYRLRMLHGAGVYRTPPGADAERAMSAFFDRLAHGALRPEPTIAINGREIPLRKRGQGVVWFEFDALCEGPRSVADYIEIAQSFNTVLISNVPQFTTHSEDPARRFINLVDEFYDRNVNLILSAAAPIVDLYQGDRLSAEFARTQSRLIEMQSEEYLAREHRA